MNSKADTIVLNARILTMDDALPSAEALAIGGGTVLGVGSSDEVLGLRGRGTVVLDLQGAVVVPGFNDCHMHILGLGITLLGADVSPDAGVRDVPSLIAALRQWNEKHPGEGWIRAYGYNQNAFPEARHATVRDLDAAVAGRPVVVFHVSGHAAVANSAALQAAGIGAYTENPSGGHIERDSSGAPTGLLLETAIGLVTQVIPPLSRAERTEAILRACERLASVGVTSASDMGVGGSDMEDELSAYRGAVERGAPVRMTLCPDAAELWRPVEIPARDEFERAWSLPYPAADGRRGGLRLGSIKLYADGALTTRTAALNEPYADGTGAGMLLHSREELEDYIVTAHERGWQVATHAIGDRAIETVLAAYEKARKITKSEVRHRIEHAMMVDASIAQRMARMKVLAVLQPEFLARLGDAYVLGLGEERAARLNPVRLLLQHGVTVAFSSDCPVVPGAPLDGMRSAMERRTPSGLQLGAEQRCAFAEALAAYTRSAAAAVQDAEVGVLRPGMRADLTVLSDLPAEDGGTVRVLATLSGGTPSYGSSFLDECRVP